MHLDPLSILKAQARKIHLNRLRTTKYKNLVVHIHLLVVL